MRHKSYIHLKQRSWARVILDEYGEAHWSRVSTGVVDNDFRSHVGEQGGHTHAVSGLSPMLVHCRDAETFGSDLVDLRSSRCRRQSAQRLALLISSHL